MSLADKLRKIVYDKPVKISTELQIAMDIVRKHYKINDSQLNKYINDCTDAGKLLDYDEYLKKSWQSIYATSMAEARKTNYEGTKRKLVLKNFEKIEDKLLRQEQKTGNNMHKPSFAVYAIANAIAGTMPTPRQTKELIIPIDDEIAQTFLVAKEKLREEFGFVEDYWD